MGILAGTENRKEALEAMLLALPAGMRPELPPESPSIGDPDVDGTNSSELGLGSPVEAGTSSGTMTSVSHFGSVDATCPRCESSHPDDSCVVAPKSEPTSWVVEEHYLATPLTEYFILVGCVVLLLLLCILVEWHMIWFALIVLLGAVVLPLLLRSYCSTLTLPNPFLRFRRASVESPGCLQLTGKALRLLEGSPQGYLTLVEAYLLKAQVHRRMPSLLHRLALLTGLVRIQPKISPRDWTMVLAIIFRLPMEPIASTFNAFVGRHRQAATFASITSHAQKRLVEANLKLTPMMRERAITMCSEIAAVLFYDNAWLGMVESYSETLNGNAVNNTTLLKRSYGLNN